MHRSLIRWAALAAWSSACACGAPFVGVAQGEGSAAASSGEAASGAALVNGGKPGIVIKPTHAGSGGAAAGALGEGGAADGGEPIVAPPHGCPSLGGGRLVQAEGFCVDESEVTVAQYRAFLDSGPSVLDQPAACATNTTFANNCKFTSPEKEPQRCADWCDARAYCASVGKRLCGSTEGGALRFDAPGASAQDQWYAACSRGGERAYPYGTEYDGSACRGADNPGSGALTVMSASACVGGYDGVWDMSGSLAEWVDSCSAEKGPTDACRIRGGSSSGSAEELRCDAVTATARNTSSSYIGFRCCVDLGG
jgi:hypothetical protein